jgi:hypothetical protein
MKPATLTDKDLRLQTREKYKKQNIYISVALGTSIRHRKNCMRSTGPAVVAVPAATQTICRCTNLSHLVRTVARAHLNTSRKSEEKKRSRAAKGKHEIFREDSIGLSIMAAELRPLCRLSGLFNRRNVWVAEKRDFGKEGVDDKQPAASRKNRNNPQKRE